MYINMFYYIVTNTSICINKRSINIIIMTVLFILIQHIYTLNLAGSLVPIIEICGLGYQEDCF